MVVRTNVLALNSHRNLGLVGNQQARASARLSSGFRINSAADDAAGLAISEGMRAQIRGMNQASRNAQDGISLIQTAEGFMQTVTEMVQRSRELAVQAANDTYSTTNRETIRNEIQQLEEEIVRIWESASFNGETLFGASGAGGAGVLSGTLSLQVGADGTTSNALIVDVEQEMGAFHDGLTITATDSRVTSWHTAVNQGAGGNHGAWQTMITNIDNTLDSINDLRASLGAYQNRLEFTIQNLDIAAENLSASESRIRDADMAAEMMRLTQANVLQQAATAMLAQANQAPQSILQLLG